MNFFLCFVTRELPKRIKVVQTENPDYNVGGVVTKVPYCQDGCGPPPPPQHLGPPAPRVRGEDGPRPPHAQGAQPHPQGD